MAIVFTVGLALGTLAYRCGGTLLGIYSSDPEVIAYGLDRMKVICQIYFLCGMMDVAVGILRGMGYSIMPMLVSLAGACGLRIVWIFTVFVWKHSLFVLYLSSSDYLDHHTECSSDLLCSSMEKKKMGSGRP